MNTRPLPPESPPRRFTRDRIGSLLILVFVVAYGVQGQNIDVLALQNGEVFNEQNLKWVIQNTAGWANFLACMKAYLEYGINLRKGAYEFMRVEAEN